MRASTVLKSEIKSLAMGKFDGVHIAHMELFKRLCDKGGVLVIDKSAGDLTPGDDKVALIPYPLFMYDFLEIKELSGVEFVKKIEEDFKNLQKIVVGYDFMFGKGRLYCADDLRSIFRGEVVIVPEVKVDGISVHSGIVREFVKYGDMESVKKLLGREYAICGHKVRGQGIGKEHLVATINIEAPSYLLPSEGVYATRTKLGDESFDSVTFIGHRVSTDRSFAIETHILDATPLEREDMSLAETICPLAGKLQGIEKDACVLPHSSNLFEREIRTIRIFFIKKLRDNHKYDSIKELKEQIESDVKNAKTVLGMDNG